MNARQRSLGLAMSVLLGWAQPTALAARPSGGAFSPFHSKYFLAAGSGEAGFQDGYFLDATFRRPEGLALSKDESTLYVADRGNHALRCVDLDGQYKVGTFCGNGEAGLKDGAGSAARLSCPSQVALSKDGNFLWLLDQGGRALRVVDLKRARVDTLTVTAQALSPAAQVLNANPLALSQGAQGLSLGAQALSPAAIGPDPDRAAEPFSTVAVDPDGDGAYLVERDRLWRWNRQAGSMAVVGQDPSLDCDEGRLVASNGELYYCSPCRQRFFRVDSPFALTSLGGEPLLPNSSGFCPLIEAGNCMALYWAPGQGALARYFWGDPRPNYYPMSDFQGAALPGPSLDLMGPGASSDRRQLLKQTVCLQAASNGTYYATESVGNRILGFDSQLLQETNQDNNALRMNQPKPRGAQRLLVVGDSMAYYWQSLSPEKRPNIFLNFVRQLELNLNLESALQGTGQRWETWGMVRQLAGEPGPANFFPQKAPELRGHQVDRVLIVLDYMSVCRDAFAFTFNRTEDDLNTLPQQADWFAAGNQQYSQLGPLTRGLFDWVRSHPTEVKGVAEIDPAGRLYFMRRDRELLDVPRFREFAAAVLKKSLRRCKAAAEAQGAKLAVVLLPTRDLVAICEGGGDDCYDHINTAWLDQPLADAAQDLGIGCYNLTEPARLVAVPLYPFTSMSDHHYGPRGQTWLATLLAREMTGTVPSISPVRGRR